MTDTRNMTLPLAAVQKGLLKESKENMDALVKALRPFIEALPGHEHAKLIDRRYGNFKPIQATVTKAQMQAARQILAKMQLRARDYSLTRVEDMGIPT